jgi:P4 family phage/plasmid primase-like protien
MQVMRDRAIALNALGIAIIPLYPEDTMVKGELKTRKSPMRSQDNPFVTPAAITGCWHDGRKDAPPLIGVVSGLSKVPFIFLDLDVHGDNNGYVTLDNAGLEIPETTIRYTSESGKGEHLWFKVPAEALGLDLTARGGLKYNGHRLLGVDNRVGNGYLHFPDTAPIPTQEQIDELPDSEDWIWNTSIRDTKSTEATSFEGKPSAWMDALQSMTEGPYAFGVEVALRSVMSLIMQGKNIDYDTMRDTQYALIREGAKGSSGAYQAIKFLESQYLSPEYNTPVFQKKWQDALETGIRDYGVAEVEAEQDSESLNKYFSVDGKKKKYLAHTRALDLAETTAIDGAGAFWSYENGVWTYNPLVHYDTLTSELGDAYLPTYTTLVHDHLRSILSLQNKVIIDQPNTDLINVKNGMYNWRTGELLPHDQKYMSTVQLGVSYDPSATSPHFDKWLSETLPGDEALGIEVIGYMLMSGNPFHIIPLLVGNGRNGKSTYLRIIQKMIGEKNYSGLDLNQLSTDKFAPVSMYGKLANICPDIHQKHLSNTGMLKRVTGGDPIQGERKGQNSFQFTPWATLIFSTNELWSSSDTSEAYFERWLPVPFNQKFSANGSFDENLLYAEMNGIFNKAMASLRTLHKNHGFTKSDSQKKLEDEFLLSADPVMQWLSDPDYVTVADPENRTEKTKKTELFTSFIAYRKGKANGIDRKKFYESLEKKGYVKTSPQNVEHFYGISIRSIDMFGDVSSYEVPQHENVVTLNDWTKALP